MHMLYEKLMQHLDLLVYLHLSDGVNMPHPCDTNMCTEQCDCVWTASKPLQETLEQLCQHLFGSLNAIHPETH